MCVHLVREKEKEKEIQTRNLSEYFVCTYILKGSAHTVHFAMKVPTLKPDSNNSYN